mgnify:CR=1 FL=1
MMRLDKYLAERTGMTRSESRKAVTKGRVSIDGAVCRKADTQLDEHTAALDPATAEKVLELTKSIVAEKKITCLMVTHNMHQALELGNRTLMMDAGRIVFDVKGEERRKMTVDDLLEKFRENAGKALDNDRILLSKVEADN